MERLKVSRPTSGGLLLSYKCSSECRHCMYASSPEWNAHWISKKDLNAILEQLSGSIQASPYGPDRVSVNSGLQFTGGEPFLNPDLLTTAVRATDELDIPSTFVETNCCWCTDDETTRNRFLQLKALGLDGILISVNPFILEHVPFGRTERAVRIGLEEFGANTIVYQTRFFNQFNRLGLKGTLSFEAYLEKFGLRSLLGAELLLMGRLPYRLGHLFERYPARRFSMEDCAAELTRTWHIHVDNFGNYMTGYCGGISLGNMHLANSIWNGIDLKAHPVLSALVSRLGNLLELGYEFGYRESSDGYISKCHLCIDVRRHLVAQTDEFKELSPREFYRRI